MRSDIRLNIKPKKQEEKKATNYVITGTKTNSKRGLEEVIERIVKNK